MEVKCFNYDSAIHTEETISKNSLRLHADRKYMTNRFLSPSSHGVNKLIENKIKELLRILLFWLATQKIQITTST